MKRIVRYVVEVLDSRGRPYKGRHTVNGIFKEPEGAQALVDYDLANGRRDRVVKLVETVGSPKRRSKGR